MKKLLAIVALSLLFTCSAQAADWNFYGAAKIDFFHLDADYKGELYDFSNLSLTTPTTGLIGARVKVSDSISAWFEYGSEKNTANIRGLWATYNFGAGQLGIGQSYTPLNLFYSKQTYGNDGNMVAFGGVYSGRAPMIRLKFGGFQIAVVEPNTALDDKTPTPSTTTTEVRFPTIETKYTLRGKNWMGQATAGYNSFEVTSGTNSFDVDSYLVALGGSVNLGSFYFKGDVYMGQNIGNLVKLHTTGAFNADGTLKDDGLATLNATGDSLIDRENKGYLFLVGYHVNDSITLEAGYGHADNDQDGTTVKDDLDAYYAQARIKLAPGVMMVPEVGYLNFNQTDNYEPEAIYYGARFQINF